MHFSSWLTSPHIIGKRDASASFLGAWHRALIAALQVDASGIAPLYLRIPKATSARRSIIPIIIASELVKYELRNVRGVKTYRSGSLYN
jgi:hypothetical protein